MSPSIQCVLTSAIIIATISVPVVCGVAVIFKPFSPADSGIGVIRRACQESGYVLLVTADHGNAERMIDEAGKPVTKHTTFRGEQSLDLLSWDGLFHVAEVVLIFGTVWKRKVGVVTLIERCLTTTGKGLPVW